MAATTPLLAVVCKRMQRLPTILGPVEHHGKVRAHKTKLNSKETMCNALVWPQQCWNQAVQTDPTLLQYVRFGDHGA